MNPNQVLSVLVQEWISLQRRLNGLHPWSVDELLRLYDEGIHISSELFRAIVAEEEISA